jgi:hypothetical protein
MPVFFFSVFMVVFLFVGDWCCSRYARETAGKTSQKSRWRRDYAAST